MARTKVVEMRYQGFHTHPCHDSSAEELTGANQGVLLVRHRIDKREGYVITILDNNPRMTLTEIKDTLNAKFVGGHNSNHVAYVLKRLQKGGFVTVDGMRWSLVSNGRKRWENTPKEVRQFT